MSSSRYIVGMLLNGVSAKHTAYFIQHGPCTAAPCLHCQTLHAGNQFPVSTSRFSLGPWALTAPICWNASPTNKHRLALLETGGPEQQQAPRERSLQHPQAPCVQGILLSLLCPALRAASASISHWHSGFYSPPIPLAVL